MNKNVKELEGQLGKYPVSLIVIWRSVGKVMELRLLSPSTLNLNIHKCTDLNSTRSSLWDYERRMLSKLRKVLSLTLRKMVPVSHEEQIKLTLNIFIIIYFLNIKFNFKSLTNILFESNHIFS